MIRLRIIPDPFHPDTSRDMKSGAQPGDMWLAPWMDLEREQAWAIVLPNGSVWYTTQTTSTGRWEITGEPPRITVRPSIWDQDPKNGWHGFITDGRLEEA